jgi:hypothetical protein
LDDIVGEVTDSGSPGTKPKPQAKLTWGSLTDGAEKTMARLKMAVDQRMPKHNEL